MAEKTREDMQVFVKGRLMKSVQWQSKQGEIFFDNFITSPSKDEFSHPARHLVKSNRKIGKEGADVEVLCNVTTFVRSGDNGIRFYDNHLWEN